MDYLCNATLDVNGAFRYRYLTINNLLRNNFFQQNLVIASAIYWKLSVQHYILISLNLIFLLCDVYGVTFFEHSVYYWGYGHLGDKWATVGDTF